MGSESQFPLPSRSYTLSHQVSGDHVLRGEDNGTRESVTQPAEVHSGVFDNVMKPLNLPTQNLP